MLVMLALYSFAIYVLHLHLPQRNRATDQRRSFEITYNIAMRLTSKHMSQKCWILVLVLSILCHSIPSSNHERPPSQ